MPNPALWSHVRDQSVTTATPRCVGPTGGSRSKVGPCRRAICGSALTVVSHSCSDLGSTTSERARMSAAERCGSPDGGSGVLLPQRRTFTAPSAATCSWCRGSNGVGIRAPTSAEQSISSPSRLPPTPSENRNDTNESAPTAELRSSPRAHRPIGNHAPRNALVNFAGRSHADTNRRTTSSGRTSAPSESAMSAESRTNHCGIGSGGARRSASEPAARKTSR
jgi:hypothetical protein